MLQADAPLDARTTFKVPARAAWLAELTHPDQIPELLGAPEATGAVLVLGEGSNILFTRDFDGLVLVVAMRGIFETGEGRVRVAAGENWHAFVRWSLDRGYAGLENLALIPGSVGAAPIQNIGAYGTELDEFVACVTAWDRSRGEFVDLDNAECAFTYRDSMFKRDPERFIVTSVEFVLPRERELQLDYAGVRAELDALDIADPSHADVADAVERLRRRKLPDPAEIGNAGSFFKNPVVANALAAELCETHEALPAWSVDEHRTKLSAAWMIEACGLKGLRDGDAGISDKHALVLVNHGHATGAQLWSLARRAREAVRQKFGIELEVEPRVV